MKDQKIISCLWFDGQAEEAANFYTYLFEKSSIGEITRSEWVQFLTVHTRRHLHQLNGILADLNGTNNE